MELRKGRKGKGEERVENKGKKKRVSETREEERATGRRTRTFKQGKRNVRVVGTKQRADREKE